MDLSEAAQFFLTNSFDFFQLPAKTWALNQAVCRLAPVDRFQTLYSAPLHLRTAHVLPAFTPPDSRTVRVNGTDEVYLMGQARDDVGAVGTYNTLYNLRLVTGLAGGLYKINRKATQGSGTDLGPLVNSVVHEYYGDLQPFSVKLDAEQQQEYLGEFTAVFASTADVQEWDFIEAPNGERYKILEPHFESGFLYCRAQHVADPRVDVTYTVNTLTTYVPGSSEKPTNSPTPYVITGFFDDYQQMDKDVKDKSVRMTFFVKASHIGFTPTKKGRITYSGTTFEIVSVQLDPAREQWRFECQA